jgi:hypothetical protein
MAQQGKYLIENKALQSCSNCGAIHDYISRPSDDAPCGTAVAFSFDEAHRVAKEIGQPREAVMAMPVKNDDIADMIVILDDSARRLPQNSGDTHVLATVVDQHIPAG